MSGVRRKSSLLLGLGLLLAVPSTSASELPGAATDGWVRWSVPKQAGTGDACCYSGLDSDQDEALAQRGCVLANGQAGAWADAVPQSFERADPGYLQILVRFAGGEAQAVHAYSADCPIRSSAAVLELSELRPATGLDWLRNQVEADPRRKTADGALVAIALQAGEPATAALVAFSAAGRSAALRRDASFWLGQARGEAGIEQLLRLVREDSSTALLEHLAFVLSQSDLAQAKQGLRSLAREHGDATVRGQSLFWIVQADWPDAESEILRALRQTGNDKIDDAAVFALSQLKHDRDAALIRLLQGDYPRAAKRQALFWLGQSGSEHALDFLDRYLARSEQ